MGGCDKDTSRNSCVKERMKKLKMVAMIHSEIELTTWKYQPPSEGYL